MAEVINFQEAYMTKVMKEAANAPGEEIPLPCDCVGCRDLIEAAQKAGLVYVPRLDLNALVDILVALDRGIL